MSDEPQKWPRCPYCENLLDYINVGWLCPKCHSTVGEFCGTAR